MRRTFPRPSARIRSMSAWVSIGKLLQPIENGLPIKFTTGLHTGCTKLLVPGDSDIKSIADLKGKRSACRVWPTPQPLFQAFAQRSRHRRDRAEHGGRVLGLLAQRPAAGARERCGRRDRPRRPDRIHRGGAVRSDPPSSTPQPIPSTRMNTAAMRSSPQARRRKPEGCRSVHPCGAEGFSVGAGEPGRDRKDHR